MNLTNPLNQTETLGVYFFLHQVLPPSTQGNFANYFQWSLAFTTLFDHVLGADGEWATQGVHKMPPEAQEQFHDLTSMAIDILEQVSRQMPGDHPYASKDNLTRFVKFLQDTNSRITITQEMPKADTGINVVGQGVLPTGKILMS